MTASPRKLTVLTKIAAVLSLGSLIWTTWSLFDLLGAGWAGITVAGCADAVWGSVIYAEYRSVRIAGRRWPVAFFGWTALIAVACYLVWHGIDENNLAMAFAGPLLPIGAKAVWVLALADMRDPSALTDDENATIAQMERGLRLDEEKHRIEMRRREMNADLLLEEVETDFRIEIRRQDKARELTRRRVPFALEANTIDGTDLIVRPTNANTPNGANDENDTPAGAPEHAANDQSAEGEQFARIGSDTALATDANSTANTAGQTVDSPPAFGFSAVLPTANGRSARTAPRSPATSGANANSTANANDREAAVAKFQESVANGSPLSGAALGRMFGRTARWGQKVIAELKDA
ncbi:hypothetical protein [Streptomyces hydrogenans]|uniref:hypothetical protein n=1 Tax=Streptomyces hydrogenans TaxID=1873719 RepID=UPI0036EA9902